MINLDETYGPEKAIEIRQNISGLFYGKSFKESLPSQTCDDFIQQFLKMSDEERISVVKKDISICIERFGYYVPRISMKQLAKDLGNELRYKQISDYEDQYSAIVKALLKPVSKND